MSTHGDEGRFGMNGNFSVFGDLPMRAALATFVPPKEERLRFIRQIGVEDLILWGTTFGAASGTREDELDAAELTAIREYAGRFGLRIFGIEALPTHWYNHIVIGDSGCERQIAHFQNSIRAAGRAGIPLLGYNWILQGVWRTGTVELRGGALGGAFRAVDAAGVGLTHGHDFVEEVFWQNYERFIEAVLPVAEAEGVTLALHPNDAPVEKIAGVPYLFRNRTAFRRAMDFRPSANHGLTFCLGCWSAMGEDVAAAIREFGAEGKLLYVHYQAVRGAVPEFHETFIDEGDYRGLNAWQVLNELRAAGFRGVMIPGHTPQLEGDVEWRPQESFQFTPYKHRMGGYRARAYTIGYLKGMLAALETSR